MNPEPSPKSSHRIRSVAITGGFLDGAVFDFADGLNCFIGARGAGKTTVVELIRYVLDTLPSRDTQPAERKRIESLIERNLAGGRVQLHVDTSDGLSYVVSRSVGEEPMVLTADGQPTEIAVQAGGFFRADIFSQNEVESIADRSTSQLALLDNFESVGLADVNNQVARVHTELASNASEILPLLAKIATLGEELATLPSVEEKLKKFAGEGGSNGDTINRAHTLKASRDRERRSVAAARQLVTDFQQELHGMSGKLGRQASSLFDKQMTTGPNKQLLQIAEQAVHDCTSSIEWLAREAGNRIAKAVDQLAKVETQLRAAHSQQELAFQKLLEKHRHAQGQAAERAQLERRRNDLLAKQRERDDLQAQLKQLEERRAELLAKRSELLDERFEIRHSVATRINASLSPAIRVSVVQFGNPERYVRLLEEKLKDARIKHLIVAQKLASFWPADLSQAVRQRDTSILVDRGELNPEQASKVIAALATPATLFELETIELVDLPKIELRDGDTYKDSSALSTGQKCTAILPILLLDSENPLLVDQPEDNLDNRFIFEAVVDSIRKVKTRRQLVFVTHNPNIPVLGDAERVFVLDSNGTIARKSNEGNVDDCKADIVTLLEGGEDAFKARKCRYAY